MDIKELAKNIVEFYEKISSWEQAVVKDSGLTTAQMHTIEIVGHGGKLRMKDLAEKMGVTTGTLTVSVDKLEKMELLARVPHETDRRSYLIVLTEEGKKLFEEHHKLHTRMTSELTDDMSEEERETFNKLIKKTLKNI